MCSRAQTLVRNYLAGCEPHHTLRMRLQCKLALVDRDKLGRGQWDVFAREGHVRLALPVISVRLYYFDG